MKNIEVTDEMYNSLMELSNNLNSQSHRCTRMPYMIQVSKKVEVAAYEGCGEMYWFSGSVRLDNEDEENEVIKEHLFEKHGENYGSIYDELEDYEKEDILTESDYRKLEVTEQDELSNFFFTEKALRRFHGEDVNTYLTGVRNPELEMVMTFLCELSGGKLHL